MFLTINGQRSYLWRAVEQDGQVLDILVQRERNKKAAKKFLKKLLRGLQYVSRVIITDKLRSYGAAKEELLPNTEHRQHKGLNNRTENSHQPTRERERRMRYGQAALPLQRFKSAGHAQRFLSVYSFIAPHFCPRRHLFTANDYRQELRQRFASWREVMGLQLTAQESKRLWW